MTETRIQKKQTAKDLIGEHMDLMLEMELVDDNSQLPALLERQKVVQQKIKDKSNSIDYFGGNGFGVRYNSGGHSFIVGEAYLYRGMWKAEAEI